MKSLTKELTASLRAQKAASDVVGVSLNQSTGVTNCYPFDGRPAYKYRDYWVIGGKRHGEVAATVRHHEAGHFEVLAGARDRGDGVGEVLTTTGDRDLAVAVALGYVVPTAGMIV